MSPSPPPPRKRQRLQSRAASGRQESARSVRALSTPPAPAPSNQLRIFSWNVNGIYPFLQPPITSFMKSNPMWVSNKADTPITTSLRNFLKRHGWPQILQLQEVKIRPSDHATKAALERAVNTCRSGGDDGPHYDVRFCLPRDKYNCNGFGGRLYGVATVIRSDFLESHVSNVRQVDWDGEGRVLIVDTKDCLSIWNVYAVNGTLNAHKDPETGEPIGTRHDKKLAFHRLMADECKRLRQNNISLILAGDFNVAREEIDGYPRLRTKPDQHIHNRKDFNDRFFDSTGGANLVDCFRHLHPKRKKYSWLPRNREWKLSCDRVDYVLCSQDLITKNPSLTEADILMTESDRGPSDHCPLWASFDLRNLDQPLW